MSKEKFQATASGAAEAGAVSKDSNPVKKRKKNAPDRPQPEWMFPPDEENPVLNPKPKSDEQVRKDKEEREESIKFLHYRSVTAPLKAPPPGQLLTLVGAFLTSYGFNAASRLYTSQCKARKKLDAWDHELDAKLPKGHPDLVKIYRDWHKEYQQESESEDSANSSDEGGSDRDEKQTSKSKNANKQQEETSSSSGSDDSDDSDARPKKKNVAPKNKTGKKIAKPTTSSTSASSSSSESDADDEKEAVDAKAVPAKPSANGLVSKSKRKASSPDTSDSGSTSEASSSEEENAPPAKKAKIGAEKKITNVKAAGKPSVVAKEPVKATVSKKTAAATSSSSSDSSTSSDSEDAKEVATKKLSSESEEESSSSESDAADPIKLPTTKKSSKITVSAKKSPDSSIPTDSSATLDIASENKTSSSSTSSSSAADARPPAKQEPKASNIKSEPEPTPKRKRSLSPHSARQAMTPQKMAKKTSTPFQRVPKDTKVDPKLASNAYVSYDYADRAHKDLIVTKGKDFTKEKNKKKRGSYRGGQIDVDGRNGIKFED